MAQEKSYKILVDYLIPHSNPWISLNNLLILYCRHISINNSASYRNARHALAEVCALHSLLVIFCSFDSSAFTEEALTDLFALLNAKFFTCNPRGKLCRRSSIVKFMSTVL